MPKSNPAAYKRGNPRRTGLESFTGLRPPSFMRKSRAAKRGRK